MNRFSAFCAAMGCVALATTPALADESSQAADASIVAQTLFLDGKTNLWTQADLIAALQLVNRKYHRDVDTLSGRRAWHGKLVSQSVSTNALTMTETYEDGTSFTFPWKVKSAAQNVAAVNARLTTAMTNGVPAALAAARLRRLQEMTATNVVTVTVTAGEEE